MNLWRSPFILLLGNFNTEPSIGACHQDSVHLAKKFREEDFKKSTNQKQELLLAAMFVTDWNEISNLYREPSINASYQVLVQMAKQFQGRRL